jgi:hypothetical protein
MDFGAMRSNKQTEATKFRSPAESAPSLLGDFLTQEELAAELGKHVQTIQRWESDSRKRPPPKIWIGRTPFYGPRAALTDGSPPAAKKQKA